VFTIFPGLGLSEDEMPQFTESAIMEERFKEIFLTKTRDEWTQVFENLDACYAPILEMDEAQAHDHNKETEIFLTNAQGKTEPAPAPKLSRTPGVRTLENRPVVGEHTESVLTENCISKQDLEHLLKAGVVFQNANSASKL
jgi:alpha-methylacyl-CoA racemase